MANARFSLTFADHNRELSNVSVRGALIDNEIELPIENAKMNALKAAILAVTIGLPVRESRTYREELLAAPTAAAASPQAQRERKWLVRYFDTVTFAVGSFEIPAADLTLLQENQEFMDPSSQEYEDLVEAIEDFVLSPDLNPVEVVEVMHVGRNT